jgi:ABC-2 type transport system ATP-binding protein
VSDNLMIEAHGLVKRYGATTALAGIDLAVSGGAILAVLGPNGAGKSTAVRILTTLTRPDEGWARVAGFDVVRQAAEVRRRIGVAAQEATLDDNLTGRQNLVMVGELSGLSGPRVRERAVELLETMELTDAADRLAGRYSGGMRRRLDLAASMVTSPPVLFLDEPTTGLDPASRRRVWEVIRRLAAQASAVLLTTQYLDEADSLADRIAVIDHGRVIAEGTPQELKRQVGGARLEITLADGSGPADAEPALRHLLDGALHTSHDGRRVRAPVRAAEGLATAAVRALDGAGILVDDIQLHQPSLDDVFLAITGHPTGREAEVPEP